MKATLLAFALSIFSAFSADIAVTINEGRTETAIPAEGAAPSIPWSEVDAIYNSASDETDLRKDEAWKRYKGKRIKWSGTLLSASKRSGSLILWVKMNPDKPASDLSIRLKDSEQSRALAVKKGDTVTFTAILDSWGAIIPLSLTDGEILGQTSDQGPRGKPDVRPRTIKEALAQLPGKMKQERRVYRKLEMSVCGVMATRFDAYDRYLMDAIKNRWDALVDERNYIDESRGKVMLQFVMHPDGAITEMKLTKNSAGEVLGYICEKAVLDPAPYPAWPAEMRRMIGEKRSLQITFYY